MRRCRHFYKRWGGSMKIMNLAIADMKKRKSAVLSLVILIIVAALLLKTGLGVFTKVEPFFQDKLEEYHGAHALITINNAQFKPEYEAFLRNDPRVVELDSEQVIYMGSVKIHFNGNELGLGGVFMNAEGDRSIAKFQLLESDGASQEELIYLPYALKHGGYNLGDSISFTYQNQTYSYRVGGFFESTALSTVNAAAIKFMLPEEGYHKLKQQVGATFSSTLLSARLNVPEQSTQLLRDLKSNTDIQLDAAGTFGNSYATDVQGMKLSSMTMINMLSMIIVAFALIIVIVCLIVIRFRLVNNIQDNMINIGALGAIGYTSKQIMGTMIVQSALIGFTGAALGILFSYGIAPLLNDMLSSLAGMRWQWGLQLGNDMITLLVLLLLMVMVTWLASRRINKLPPIIALRGGIGTHSFRRNHFALDKTKGSIHWVLACKSFASNMKQNSVMVVIIIGVTFATIFSIISYYNMVMNKTAFYNMLGVEMSDIAVTIKPEVSMEGALDTLGRMNGVTKTTTIGSTTLMGDGIDLASFVSNDYDRMNNVSTYKGRLPEYDNEIVLTGVIADSLNKGIGDTIELKEGDRALSYLITGLTQTMNNSGKIAYLTLSGMQRLNPTYEMRTINVYLDHQDVSGMIKQIESTYEGQIAQLQNNRNLEKTQLSAFSSAMTILVQAVLFITAVVVSLILYLVIKTMIQQRKQEYGVYKAIGYTTYQLMIQISLSFVPVILTGTILGGILASIGINPLLSVLLRTMGISHSQFTIHIPLTVLFCLGIVVFAYTISMLVAYRVKHISAHSLIVE